MDMRFVKESGYYRGWMDAWPLVLLAAAAILLSAWGGDASPGLRYERSAVLAGEWWRLLSGQLVHLGVSHLLLNLAGLAMIGWVFGPGVRGGQWSWLLVMSLSGISTGFLLLEPGLRWYVGLSGVLHGLLLGAACIDRGLGWRTRIVLIIGVIMKLAWEQWAGALPFTAEAAGGPVVVDAHLYGGVGGLLGGGLAWLRAARSRV